MRILQNGGNKVIDSPKNMEESIIESQKLLDNLVTKELKELKKIAF